FNAARQLLPLSSDTSRSDEVPPMSTATRPKSRASVTRLGPILFVSTMTHLAHDAHLSVESHTMLLFHRLPHVTDQLFDVRGARRAIVDDEVRVHLRHSRAADAKAFQTTGFDQACGVIARRIG